MTIDKLYLAMDQGGHSSRALVYTAGGDIVARAQRPITTQTPAALQVEHDPMELAQSLQDCCDDVANQLGRDASRIRCAGLATQRSSIVCWERESGQPLTQVLSWQDRRAHAITDAMEAHTAKIEELTGLVVSPHYGASKLKWCLDNSESVQRAQHKGNLTVGPLASFLLRQLVRDQTDRCDPANASRTLLWDRLQGNWSDELCQLFGVPKALLPRSVSSSFVYGRLRTGNLRIPLRLLTGDQSAAIYAFGKMDAHRAFINLGTGAFLQWPTGTSAQNVPGLLNSVVYQDATDRYYVLEGTVNGAGRALSWWAEQHGLDSKALVAKAVQQFDKNTTAPSVFVNGISGLGSPYWRGTFRSYFSDASVSPEAGALAIIESIVFLLEANLTRACSAMTTRPELVLTGGLSNIDYLCQALADICKTRVIRSTLSEATATGAAWLLAQSNDWRTDAQEQLFTPTENPALMTRHSQWLELMAGTLTEE